MKTGTVPVSGLYNFVLQGSQIIIFGYKMVISAIEIKLLAVQTVAQYVSLKVKLSILPKISLCMNYGLQMKAMSAIEIRSRQIGKTG